MYEAKKTRTGTAAATAKAAKTAKRAASGA
jgi:hypothetical protein